MPTNPRPSACAPASDSRAVSSVVGTVLVVALAVILAALTSSGALGIVDRSANPGPAASIQADWVVEGANDALVLRHEAGTGLDADRLTVTVDGATVYAAGVYDPDGLGLSGDDGWSGGVVSSGDTVVFTEDGDDFDAGATVRVYYQGDDESYVVFKEN